MRPFKRNKRRSKPSSTFSLRPADALTGLPLRSLLRFERLETRHMLTASLQTLHSFTGTDAEDGWTGLAIGGSTIYGSSVGGGQDSEGTIFSVGTNGAGHQILDSLSYYTTGGDCSGMILSGSTLYGTMYDGGGSSYGDVFSVNTNGTDFTILHSFTDSTSDGGFPDAGLTIVGSTLYGTTVSGGTANDGTVFSISTSGTGFQLLHSFAGGTSDGASPVGGLAVSGSTLYGTTERGGSSGDGTVFSVSTSGSGYGLLHSFSGGDGVSPDGPLVINGSSIYGTTDGNGDGIWGSVFAMNTSGSGFQTLHTFSVSDGAYASNLVLSGSTLYGTTGEYGPNGQGTLFSVGTSGTGFTTLHSFPSATGDGEDPMVLALSGSTLYGTAQVGGSAGDGTVFSISTAGTGYQTLLSLGTASDGAGPGGGVTLSGSTIYGVTGSGGSSNDGTIYSENSNGTGYQVLYNFVNSQTNGAYPSGTLLLVGSTLYGTTGGGGAYGDGTIFSINTNGTNFQILHSFTDTSGDGDDPYGGLTLNGSTLYGTTQQGGSAGYGTIFSISTAGSGYQILHSFTGGGSDGESPEGTLALSGSTLYGTTYEGGTANEGTVYSIATSGSGFSLLHSFTGGGGDGENPEAGLTLSGSTLYGTTDEGGDASYYSGYGTIFSISTSGSGFAVLYGFSPTGNGGLYPDTGLTLSGSTLYGTASDGGANGDGAVFSYNLSGAGYQTVYSFTTATIYNLPAPSSVVLSGSSLYGTTQYGGSNAAGSVFSLSLPTVTVTPSGSSATFTPGGSAVTIDSSITVTSSDTDLTGAAVQISNEQSGDSLNFANQNGITGSYNTGTGTLTLSGTATVAQYQAALQSITFSTTSSSATARSLTVVAEDGGADSNSAAEQVNIALVPNLEITTSDNWGGSSATSTTGTADRGGPITYTITVTNAGTAAATGATIADTLPSALTGVTYTATETGGASGFTASGSGNIDDTAVSLPVDSAITYTVVATISLTASGTLSNTATVNLSAGAGERIAGKRVEPACRRCPVGQRPVCRE